MTPTDERLLRLAKFKGQGVTKFTVRVYDGFDRV